MGNTDKRQVFFRSKGGLAQIWTTRSCGCRWAKAGVSLDVIGKIEREQTTPSLETLHRLCQALRVSLAEFFAVEPEKKGVEQEIENLRRYLIDKQLDHIQFADQIVRQIIERLEAQ